jgi:glutathione S-transferase
VTVIREAPVPFFIRPITGMISNKMTQQFIKPNFETHYQFLESQLATSPDNGQFLCGKDLTGADFLMEFPLEVGETYSGMTKEQYPRVYEYLERLKDREGFKKAAKKVEELEGKPRTNL